MRISRSIPRQLAACFVAVAGLLLFAPDASAQRDAVIAGKVVDRAGDPIANATVQIISPDRGDSRELRTNNNGEYIGRGFWIEVYVIRVLADGYQGKEQELKTNLGMNTVDVTLATAQPEADYEGLNKLYQDGLSAYQDEEWPRAASLMTELLGGMEGLDSEEAMTMRRSAHEILAQAQVQQGQEDEAIESYKRLAELDSDSLTANSWLGDLYTRRQEFETAASYLKRAAELSPDDASIQYNAGAIMVQVGDVESGIAAMERAIVLRPEFSLALKNLGYAYLRTQEYAKSVAALEKYLELSPDAADRADVEGMIEALKAQIQ